MLKRERQGKNGKIVPPSFHSVPSLFTRLKIFHPLALSLSLYLLSIHSVKLGEQRVSEREENPRVQMGYSYSTVSLSLPFLIQGEEEEREEEEREREKDSEREREENLVQS